MNDLKRFLDAQANDFERALAEIKRGRKQSHWMWYIFPQIAGLGFRCASEFAFGAHLFYFVSNEK